MSAVKLLESESAAHSRLAQEFLDRECPSGIFRVIPPAYGLNPASSDSVAGRTTNAWTVAKCYGEHQAGRVVVLLTIVTQAGLVQPGGGLSRGSMAQWPRPSGVEAGWIKPEFLEADHFEPSPEYSDWLTRMQALSENHQHALLVGPGAMLHLGDALWKVAKVLPAGKRVIACRDKCITIKDRDLWGAEVVDGGDWE